MALELDPVLDDVDAAKALNVSLKTLRRMDARGEAPARIQISERKYGRRLSAINAFLDAREKAANAA